tara:strand:- start:83 stop:1105 length:1023 start_codon:yes stop_codon:yes gene_type:complete
VAELIIMFREVLEASLIIGILYTYLKKSNNQSSIKMLWSGVFLAIIASVVVSFFFQSLVGGFEGASSKIFEGVIMIIASIVLTTMIIWMARNQNIAQDLKDKAEKSITTGFKYGILSLAFVAVFREGVEIILFLYAIGIKDGISVIPSLVGALMALFLGYFIFIQGIKVPLKKFFNVTSVFLIFVSAGMLTYGVHELESGGVIPYFSGKVESKEYPIKAVRIFGETKTYPMQYDAGEEFNDINNNGYRDTNESYVDDINITFKKAEKWSSRVWDINPPKNSDGSYHFMHDKGSIGGLLKGFFGYNGNPSLIELITWILAVIGLNYIYQILGKKSKLKGES